MDLDSHFSEMLGHLKILNQPRNKDGEDFFSQWELSRGSKKKKKKKSNNKAARDLKFLLYL